MSEYNRHKYAMEWMHGGGRDPNGRGLDEEIRIGKEDWMERQRVAQGGRIGLQSGQLVQPGPPGVRQGYGAWNVGKGEHGQQYLYTSKGGRRTGKGYYVSARKGDQSVYKHFPSDEFEKAKAFAKKIEKRFEKVPAETTRISGQRLTVANQYAKYYEYGDDFHKLNTKQKTRILMTMKRKGDKFLKKSMFDLPSATNQEKIKNAFPDVEFDFKSGQKHGVPHYLKKWKKKSCV